MDRFREIFQSLSNKEYRDGFVEAEIDEIIAAQIRTMRTDRGWSQAQLGKHIGMAQGRVSVLEDADYGSYTLSTLKRLASAFDVGLLVRFVPFSELAGRAARLGSENLRVPSYDVEAEHRSQSTTVTDFGKGATTFSGLDNADTSGQMYMVMGNFYPPDVAVPKRQGATMALPISEGTTKLRRGA
jgi:transcriptional regulator with XRE-family HTH domain